MHGRLLLAFLSISLNAASVCFAGGTKIEPGFFVSDIVSDEDYLVIACHGDRLIVRKYNVRKVREVFLELHKGTGIKPASTIISAPPDEAYLVGPEFEVEAEHVRRVTLPSNAPIEPAQAPMAPAIMLETLEPLGRTYIEEDQAKSGCWKSRRWKFRRKAREADIVINRDPEW